MEGKIREAEVVLPNKRSLVRPINFLYPIECPNNRNFEEDLKIQEVKSRLSKRSSGVAAKGKVLKYITDRD